MNKPNRINSKVFVVGFALIIFTGFSLYSFSEICCMFGATRYYGWPYPYLVLNKTVETYEEAVLVKNEPASSLMASGWEMRFSTHMTRSVLGSPVFSLIADIAISFAIAITLFFLFSRVKRND